MSFFQNHSGWPLVPLKNIATLKRGYDLPVGARNEGAVPIYAANGKNGAHDEVKIKGPGVITGRSGTIGKVHYCEEGFWPLNTALYVMDFHGNHPRWVYYMLSAFKLERFSEGAGVPTLNRNLVHDELIPLPPLPVQKRIAAILDKADAIRRKRQQAIQLADDFLRAVFLNMFGDPVTNPKGWPVEHLKDITTKIGSGSTPRGGSEAYLEQGISLIRSLNIHDDDFRMKNLAFIDDEQAEKLSNVLVQSGDVLLNITGASVCRCAIVPTAVLPARVNQHVCIIRPSDAINSSYLLHLLISEPYKQKLLKMSGAGATREALTKQQVELLEVPIPPKELQTKFEEIKEKVRSLSSASDSFKEESFFESLSDKAFSGQL